ncbi:MAG: DNA primase small subunit domain-containing protein [Candidatus Asgardarchaeia archaeon]
MRKFRDYYLRAKLHEPLEMERREFAFIPMDKGIMFRHMKFQDVESLRRYIVRSVPSHVYYSSAFYDFPDAPKMEQKVWRGAELIFDVDSDHLDLKCQAEHDFWLCENCGYTSRRKMESCPKCSSTKVRTYKWICDNCIEKAKNEVEKLVFDFLINDFGIDEDSILVKFSGHRGFHVHVMDGRLYGMSQYARREIVGYVTGLDIDPSIHGINEDLFKGGYGLKPPSIKDPGWRGRIVRYIIRLLDDIDENSRIEGLKRSQILKICENKESIKKSLSSSNPNYRIVKGLGAKSWMSLALEAVKRYGVKIDAPVTADIKRLIRMPGTIHGKTGLIVKDVDVNSLESFDPFRDAVAFKGNEQKSIRIDVYTPKFRILDEVYGPYKPGDVVEVPEGAAIFLVSKGRGTVLR